MSQGRIEGRPRRPGDVDRVRERPLRRPVQRPVNSIEARQRALPDAEQDASLRLVPEEPPLWPLYLLLFSWPIAWLLEIGSFSLSPYRLALLITTPPCFFWWVTGRAGRIRAADIFLLLFCLWSMLGLGLLYGIGKALQSGGILFVETMGSYLVARCTIRGPEQFRLAVRILFWIIAGMLPFAVAEMLTGHNVLLETLGHVLPTHPITDKEPRWGLRRVQAIFEHPILMGVACGCLVGLVHTALGAGQTMFRRWLQTGAIALTAATSLSSGPWSGIVAQILLLGWNWALGSLAFRWKILVGGGAAMLVAVQLFAKRPLPNILFSDFAFDPQTAYFRLLIWQYGSQSVANHFWFGVGLGDWDRPSWMPPSIDMFWLYNAVMYGFPAGLLMGLAFFAAFLRVAYTRGLDQRLTYYRVGYLVSLTSLFIMGWMVHFWNATYVLFVFLFGSGMWLIDAGRPPAQNAKRPATLRVAGRQDRRVASRKASALVE